MKTINFKGRKSVWWVVLILIVIGSLFLSGCGAEEPKVYKVGVLSGLDFVAVITDGFKEGMAELGYVEGENIIYDIQTTEVGATVADYEDSMKKIAEKFVEDDVDLILVFPTDATILTKEATQGTDIPVLFNFCFVEGMGIVDSIRQPGGNITGVRYPGPDIALRRFDIMRELVPEATRFLIPYQAGYPIVIPQLEALYPAAEAAGIELIELPVDDAADLETALQSLADSGESVDAVLFVAEPLTVVPDNIAVIGKFATEQNIPVGGALIQVGEYSTVFGVNVNPVVSGKQGAPLADKIFKGTPAGTIPVVSAESYFQLNYKVAQELGLNVPEGLMKQADEIIR